MERLYLLKRRRKAQPSGVMFFGVDAALEALPALGERTRAAIEALLPGGVTLLLPNLSGSFPLACGDDPSTLGLRVPDVPLLADVGVPVLQSSANLAGEPDAARRLEDVPELFKAAVELVLDGGESPGTPSTVVAALRGNRHVVGRAGGRGTRAGARRRARWQFHFDPSTYGEEIREDIPEFDALEDAVVGERLPGRLDFSWYGDRARPLCACSSTTRTPRWSASTSRSRCSSWRDRGDPAGRASLREGRLQDPLPEASSTWWRAPCACTIWTARS